MNSKCYKCKTFVMHMFHDDGTTAGVELAMSKQIDWFKENREKAEAKRDRLHN